MSRHPIERFMVPMTSRPWDGNADISSSTACKFLEVYNNPVTCRKEIRQAGVAANLGQAALDALNEVYNQVAMTHGDTRHSTRLAHEHFTRTLATAVNHNLNQLAEDKLWPMFWRAFHHDGNRDPRYERERSSEFVATFKSDFGLSNADWKFLCNAGHEYLCNHFDIGFRRVRDDLHPIYVRWPHSIRLECRDTINRIQQQAPQLFPWLRELFKDEANHRIGPREFSYTISDYCDTLGHVPQEEAVKILKAKSWNAFRQTIARLHSGYYGNTPGMRPTVHGRVDLSTVKPTHVVKYTSIPADVPMTFNAHGCECRLIDTNEKLYEEGTGMGHCIWRLYQTRITDGKYIAYHVKYAGDDPGHKGWTLGYKLQEDYSVSLSDAMRGVRRTAEKKESEWKLDQIRGYKNEIPKHKALDAVAEMLLAVIRGDVKPDAYKKETK